MPEVSHPDHPSAPMRIKVIISIQEEVAYLESRCWAEVTREIRSTMSPAAAYVRAGDMVQRACEELELQFRNAAEVAEVNRADQVKQIGTS